MHRFTKLNMNNNDLRNRSLDLANFTDSSFQYINAGTYSALCTSFAFSQFNHVDFSHADLDTSLFVGSQFSHNTRLVQASVWNTCFFACKTTEGQVIDRAWLKAHGVKNAEAAITNCEELANCLKHSDKTRLTLHDVEWFLAQLERLNRLLFKMRSVKKTTKAIKPEWAYLATLCDNKTLLKTLQEAYRLLNNFLIDEMQFVKSTNSLNTINTLINCHKFPPFCCLDLYPYQHFTEDDFSQYNASILEFLISDRCPENLKLVLYPNPAFLPKTTVIPFIDVLEKGLGKAGLTYCFNGRLASEELTRIIRAIELKQCPPRFHLQLDTIDEVNAGYLAKILSEGKHPDGFVLTVNYFSNKNAADIIISAAEAALSQSNYSINMNTISNNRYDRFFHCVPSWMQFDDRHTVQRIHALLKKQQLMICSLLASSPYNDTILLRRLPQEILLKVLKDYCPDYPEIKSSGHENNAVAELSEEVSPRMGGVTTILGHRS